MVATTGAVPVLVAVNDGSVATPEAPRPILVVLFVQLKTSVPKAGFGVPVKVIAAVVLP